MDRGCSKVTVWECAALTDMQAACAPSAEAGGFVVRRRMRPQTRRRKPEEDASAPVDQPQDDPVQISHDDRAAHMAESAPQEGGPAKKHGGSGQRSGDSESGDLSGDGQPARRERHTDPFDEMEAEEVRPWWEKPSPADLPTAERSMLICHIRLVGRYILFSKMCSCVYIRVCACTCMCPCANVCAGRFIMPEKVFGLAGLHAVAR